MCDSSKVFEYRNSRHLVHECCPSHLRRCCSHSGNEGRGLRHGGAHFRWWQAADVTGLSSPPRQAFWTGQPCSFWRCFEPRAALLGLAALVCLWAAEWSPVRGLSNLSLPSPCAIFARLAGKDSWSWQLGRHLDMQLHNGPPKNPPVVHQTYKYLHLFKYGTHDLGYGILRRRHFSVTFSKCWGHRPLILGTVHASQHTHYCWSDLC